MKTIYIVGLLVLALSSATALSMRSRWQKPSKPIGTNKMSFYDLTVNAIDGKVMNMADYKGKYVLCVNVASKCGYTPQYEDLEKLYEQYQGKLVIIGFPCNQFLGQEPGTSEEIVSFCQKNYGVTFPLTEKIDVKGKNQHGVYQWLTQQSLNGVADGTVKWNFHKFLISPEGEWLAEFPSGVKPLDTELTSLIK
jgi:glutathione peroxidase